MRKRTKVLIAALGLVGSMMILSVTVVIVAINSDWGHSQVRGIIESTVRSRLVTGTTFRMGKLTRESGTTWVAESISLFASDGRPVATIRRAAIEISLPSVIRGDIRIRQLIIDGAQLFIEQGRDRSWNMSHLVARRVTDIVSEPGPKRRVIADSVEVRNSRIEISALGRSPGDPPMKRSIDRIAIAAGNTTLLDADGSGHIDFSTLSATIDNPPVIVRSAQGGVRWWSDSLTLNVPKFRLPASRASASGSIAWPKDGVHLAIDVVADSVSPTDIRWMSGLIPSEGLANARVAVRTPTPGELSYEVQEFDLRAFKSHVNGSFVVTPGRKTEVRDLKLAMQPLDLALVRNIFGDTILKQAWQGAIDGTLTARGGFLDHLVIDSVKAKYTDARVSGATSRFMMSGAMNVADKTTELIGMRVRIDSMDIRTVGAVVRTADSLSGALKGSLVLDGPTKDVAFTEMRIRHVDGAKTPSVVSGSGRIASDIRGHWMDATITLDTIAIATLAPDSLALPLHGIVSGTLVVGATADTMSIEARLKAGDATAHLTGTTLLDSLRTLVEMHGTIAGLDLREFVSRKNIPAHAMSGAVRIEIDQTARYADRHIELQLDSTSRIGESKISSATIRFGSDSTGIHLDTADVRADRWRVEARGQLAAKGRSTTDSITFSTQIDSLGALRMILLDTAGKPRFETLGGAVTTKQGVLKGSFEHAELRTDIGAANLVIGSTNIAMAVGNAQVDNLPDSASGFFRGTIAGLANGGFLVDTARLRADLFGGQRARVTASATRGDTVNVTFGAEVTWPDSTYTIHVDSLRAAIGKHTWTLNAPANAKVVGSAVWVDSLVMKSDEAAQVALFGRFPNTGAIDARVDIRRLGFEELAFLGIFPPEVSGLISGSATVKGTRDAPVIEAKASLDSIKTEETKRPALTFEGKYANKKMTVSLNALEGGVRVLAANGDVPIDLTLRTVESRVIDAPMSLKLKADSMALKTFEGLVPKVRGLGGYLTADVDVGGTVRRPRGTGTLALKGGEFDVERYGFAARDANALITLAGDSVIVKSLRLADAQSPRDTLGISGAIHLAGERWADWGVRMHTAANRFRVIEDPRSGTADVSWSLDIAGDLGAPRITGNVEVPYAEYTIGPTRRTRQLFNDTTAAREYAEGIPTVDGVLVTFGQDVRLRSKDANVQLTGSVELFGSLTDPWLSGAVNATRGTYRVNVGPIKRTFHVDSGSVIIEGTKDIPAGLDIYTSYLVRSPTEDVTIWAHVYGTTSAPRLDLTSDRGSTTPQGEIISYLVFGKSSFGIDDANKSNLQSTATAAFLPSLSGFLEATLGTVLPFFSTLQVTSTDRGVDFGSIRSNPLEAALNSYALTGGRQVGSDTFLSLSAGRCSASRTSSTGAAPFWYGAAADYRPKRSVGVSFSIDPGPAPCSRVASVGDTYQLGFDLGYDWKFGRKKKP